MVDRDLSGAKRAVRRKAVMAYNGVLGLVPFGVKYGLGKHLRLRRVPYRLVRQGSTVVQVGAPRDILRAGRSRGIYFSMMAGLSGTVVIIEPDPVSVECLKNLLERQSFSNVVVCPLAAWSSPGEIKLYTVPDHPAGNYVEQSSGYVNRHTRDHPAITVPTSTIDNILERLGIQHVDLVSITTNGAEAAILQGMKKTVESGLQYISVACRSREDVFEDDMNKAGFSLFSADDRGLTYKRL